MKGSRSSLLAVLVRIIQLALRRSLLPQIRPTFYQTLKYADESPFFQIESAFSDAEMFYDRGNHYEFLSLVQELASPGEMRAAQNFDFEFKNVEKQYESYNGINVKLR